MKTQSIIIIFFIIAFCAVCSELQAQFDTTGLAKGDVLRFDGTSFIDRLPIKLRKAHIETVVMGTTAVYLPESDVQGGNAYNSLAKIITYQLPLSVNPTAAQLTSISNYITSVLEPTAPPIVIDSTTVDSEQGTVYSNWPAHGATTAPGWHAGTISYGTAAGATASYTFTGRQVKIYAERLPSHGSGTVTILQGSTVIKTSTVVFIGPKALPVKVYDSGILPDGTYTVVLKADGNGPAMLDFFRVFKKR